MRDQELEAAAAISPSTKVVRHATFKPGGFHMGRLGFTGTTGMPRGLGASVCRAAGVGQNFLPYVAGVLRGSSKTANLRG